MTGDGTISATDLLDRLEAIVEMTRSKSHLKDILIKEDELVRCVVPKKFLALDADHHPIWTRENLVSFFDHLCPGWEKLIVQGAIDRPISMSDSRYRVNLFTYGGDFSKSGDMRYPGKLAMAVRVIPQSIPELATLGLPNKISSIANAKAGLLIITGPVGGGKTTTAASFINHRNMNSDGHIITIEHPIEIVYTPERCSITQRELGGNVESMARGAYDAMREFPEAIMIGEIREPDAAEAALFTGNAGQLVIGTMHANSAVASLAKFCQYFPDQEAKASDLATCIQGVISPILVPSKNGETWVPIFETIACNNEKVKELIISRSWTKLQTELETGVIDGCSSRNRSLAAAIKADKISREDALLYSLNRTELQDLLR